MHRCHVTPPQYPILLFGNRNLQGNIPLLIAFTSKLAFFVALIYIIDVLFYYKLLVIVLEVMLDQKCDFGED